MTVVQIAAWSPYNYVLIKQNCIVNYVLSAAYRLNDYICFRHITNMHVAMRCRGLDFMFE